MIYPRRIDGKGIRVSIIPGKGVYVDAEAVYEEQQDGSRKRLHRGGPEVPNHYCRYEDYGLADGFVRCRKCGKVGKCA